jgi:hypothetical protein
LPRLFLLRCQFLLLSHFSLPRQLSLPREFAVAALAAGVEFRAWVLAIASRTIRRLLSLPSAIMLCLPMLAQVPGST